MDDRSRNTEGAGPVLRARLPSPSTTLVCLNFKVPLRVRQRFKIYAARHNMTMTDLLLQLLDDCLAAHANPGSTDTIDE
jgi:hypothetical protein